MEVSGLTDEQLRAMLAQAERDYDSYSCYVEAARRGEAPPLPIQMLHMKRAEARRALVAAHNELLKRGAL